MRFITYLILLSCFTSTSLFAQKVVKQQFKLMGTAFEISVVAKSQEEGQAYIELAAAEIQRIENLISSWDPNSQTSTINQQAGQSAVVVDQELVQLIQRAQGISQLSDGAFDISYASMDRIWHFDGRQIPMPPVEKVTSAVAKVGYHNIIIDATKRSVYLPMKGMKIGFGGIGKGYAADRAATLLQEQGVTAGIINAAGDMTVWGKQPNGQDWQVGITNPLNKNKVFAWLPISSGAVVTSGNYEKFVLIDGERYAHIIDPRTGYPSKGILSVTVFAPKAELADALATAIFVMGTTTGLHFINQLPNVECVIIDDHGKIFTSQKIQLDAQTN